MIGFAMTGSHCTLSAALRGMEALVSLGYELQPIMSDSVYSTDTRFFEAKRLCDRVEEIYSPYTKKSRCRTDITFRKIH